MGEALRNVIGQPRACLLYDRADADANAQVAHVRCVRFVAGRVMSVREVSDTVVELVFQPAVMTSRSAVTASEISGSVGSATADPLSHVPNNSYLYKLRLTN